MPFASTGSSQDISCERDTQHTQEKTILFLVMSLPKDSSHPAQPNAAMLRFPTDVLSFVLQKLRSPSFLYELDNFLENIYESENRMEELQQWLQEKGCASIEVCPVCTVGYYYLETVPAMP